MTTGTEYYWSVRVYMEGQWSAYAPSRAIEKVFVPIPLDQPALLKPAGGMGIALPDYFSWVMPSGAEKVLIEFADASDPDFIDPIGGSVSTRNNILVPAMPVGQIYYWRLKAVAEGAESEWSSPGSFGRDTACGAKPCFGQAGRTAARAWYRIDEQQGAKPGGQGRARQSHPLTKQRERRT